MQQPNNRARLLTVALDLFAAWGYEASGVQEIVAAAGVTKPTLYHYFGSKRGLLDAVLAERATPFLRDLAAAAAYEGDLPAALNRVIALYLHFAATQPTFLRLLLGLFLAPPEQEAYRAAAPIFAEQHRRLEELFAAAARDHGNMRGRQERYAVSLFGTLNAYAFLVLNSQVVPDERLRHDVLHQFSHGIYS